MRVLVRIEAVVDEMLALDNGGFHMYFARHVSGALNAHVAGMVEPTAQSIRNIARTIRLYMSNDGRAHLRHAILFHLVYNIFREKGCLASQRNFFGYFDYSIMKVCAEGPRSARAVVDMPTGGEEGNRNAIVDLLLQRIFFGYDAGSIASEGES